MNFIDSCQSLVSGREGCREGGREGKKNDGGEMQEIVRLMYTEVVRNTIACRVFSFFSFPFFSFFLSFFFLPVKKRISNCFHPMIEREREREYTTKERNTLIERNTSEFSAPKKYIHIRV